MESTRSISLHLVLTIFLGIGMVLFGVLAVVAYQDNTEIHATLDQRNAKAASDAAAKQKIDDVAANAKANENPYKTYTAEPVNGGFQLALPKNWSVYAGSNANGTTRFQLLADLDTVTQNETSNAVNTHALRVQLQARPLAEVNREFNDRVKKKLVTTKAVTVSGINANWYEGQFDDQKHNGVAVVLQVRDKVMIISTDNRSYLDQFNTILGAAKITP